MTKRIIFVIFWLSFIIVVVVLISRKVEEKKIEVIEKEAIKAEIQTKESLIQLKFNELIEQTRPVINWQGPLIDSLRNSYYSFGRGKILSIDIERLWLIDQPILFLGRLDDILSLDNNYYNVKIDVHIPRTYLSGDFYLCLKCPKDKIDEVLTNHPEIIFESYPTKRLSIIANIHKIITEDRLYDGYDGLSKKRYFIGEGECLEVLFIGNYIPII